eukprot:198890-Chlamydomonas_euryale.AAC.3
MLAPAAARTTGTGPRRQRQRPPTRTLPQPHLAPAASAFRPLVAPAAAGSWSRLRRRCRRPTGTAAAARHPPAALWRPPPAGPPRPAARSPRGTRQTHCPRTPLSPRTGPPPAAASRRLPGAPRAPLRRLLSARSAAAARLRQTRRSPRQGLLPRAARGPALAAAGPA